MSISTAVATLRPTMERLAEFAALQPDWDSYGGLPASPRAVSTATELLVLLADRLPAIDPDRLVPFAVAPIANAGVQLEWTGPRHTLEVEVGPQGEFGCLLVEQRGDQPSFEEHDAVPLPFVLDLLTLVLTGEHPR